MTTRCFAKGRVWSPNRGLICSLSVRRRTRRMPFRKGAEGCMATKSVSVGMMRAAQVGKAGGDFELVDRDIPEPRPGQVRVKVEACGICHSDVLVKEGWWPGLQYPRVPGHEIAGRVDAIGGGVTIWKPGQRV